MRARGTEEIKEAVIIAVLTTAVACVIQCLSDAVKAKVEEKKPK